MKNKSYLSIKKGIKKYEKINERPFNKVSVSSHKSKIAKVLGWLRLRLLPIRVGEIGAILEQFKAFEKKNALNFYIGRCSEKL